MTKPRGKGKPFVKGDPRINRNGRPKSFDKLRKLAQQLAHEDALDARGQPLIVDGQKQTQITMLLRQMIRENPVKFLEYAFGKPKDEITISGNIDVTKLSDEELRKLASGKGGG